ncbi:ornithine carbamoyltransferase [Candidatus Borrarchaeum sp.]|uniref:ornithine carbamoyltransferase n=1 Tax=Candidatus Borrarchaeum sp. TaxID=2846742 RepID=UPI00257BB024|nr:ornithine carbamoyltransferase [Candidatus Borrarchaeum sp.]
MDIRGQDFFTLQDFSFEEIHYMLDIASDLKKMYLRGESSEILNGKTLAMIFEKSSTRTRVSFEVAMRQLGGYALFLGAKDLQLGRGETIPDTARTLARYVDGIMARVYSHEDLLDLADFSQVPVINGLSDLFHPCQILADLLTIKEKRKNFENLKISYVGDGNNVCNSLLIGCSKLGINISVGCPENYEPLEDVIDLAKDNARIFDSEVQIVHDPQDAVLDADVVYTDTFISMGQEAEAEERMEVFPPFQVNQELLNNALINVIVMHCLPAHRGQEITDEVIDGPNSVVWDQAENRLHAQKAILTLLL